VAAGGGEHLLDGQAEQLGDSKGERQRRVVLARLDGVDALPRDAETLGEVALAPVALGAQDSEPVVQARPLRETSARLGYEASMSGSCSKQ